MNVQISAIKQAGEIKLGTTITPYNTQLKFILNFSCHAHWLHKSINSIIMQSITVLALRFDLHKDKYYMHFCSESQIVPIINTHAIQVNVFHSSEQRSFFFAHFTH